MYGVLHHPEYRARYAANLRRELPRVPFVGAAKSEEQIPHDGAVRNDKLKKGNGKLKEDQKPKTDVDVFRAFVGAGKRLAELHVGYESVAEYGLERVEALGEKRDLRVVKMKLSKDKTSLRYNDFLTLKGIPAEALEYRLGNRSALEWVVDQYQVFEDKRSGIVNDPNREDDEEYILRLVGQVITVSLETVEIVKGLPGWVV